MTQGNPRKAVADGLFDMDDAGVQLIGTHCVSCDTLYFPQMLSCRNPACREKQLERRLLPSQGTLYSYTVQRYQPPSLFRMDNWAPYALGLVDLGEGLLVMGMLLDIAFDDIAIGMSLKLALAPLSVDDHGQEIVTYAFVAAEAALQENSGLTKDIA